jgi:hypothetical protein
VRLQTVAALGNDYLAGSSTRFDCDFDEIDCDKVEILTLHTAPRVQVLANGCGAMNDGDGNPT